MDGGKSTDWFWQMISVALIQTTRLMMITKLIMMTMEKTVKT